MQLSPSSALGWSASAAARPGKRKMNDAERFEPYNSAFKRRAVSPSASSVSLSPLLTQANLASIPVPPLNGLLPTLGPAANISGVVNNNSNNNNNSSISLMTFPYTGGGGNSSSAPGSALSANGSVSGSVPPSPSISSSTTGPISLNATTGPAATSFSNLISAGGGGAPSSSAGWLASRSRASSPAPSLSSSAGGTRRWAGGNGSGANANEEDGKRVDLAKMSLG